MGPVNLRSSRCERTVRSPVRLTVITRSDRVSSPSVTRINRPGRARHPRMSAGPVLGRRSLSRRICDQVWPPSVDQHVDRGEPVRSGAWQYMPTPSAYPGSLLPTALTGNTCRVLAR